MPAASNDAQTWELHKSNILHLYFIEGMTLEKLMGHMKQKYGFNASKGQYESQFQKWNLRKNLKSSEWKYVSHRVQKRKKEGKESAVYFNKVAIAPEKVKKETSRYDVPTYYSAPTPKTPNDISVCTPASVASAPSPDELHDISENGYISPSNTLTIGQCSGLEALATCFKLHALPDWFVEFARQFGHMSSRRDVPSRFKASLFEKYGGDFPVTIGILLGADLQDRLFGSNKEPMLLLTVGGSGFDQVVMVVQGGQLLATSNMAGAAVPLFQLILAAYCGNTHGLSVFLALEEGRHLVRTRCGAIALHIAVECSQIDIVAGLLATGVHADVHDDVGDTALHRATRKEDEAMMVHLLNHGHPVDAKDRDEKTPWSANTRYRNEKVLNILLAYKANPNTTDRNGASELHHAARGGDTAYVEFLLGNGTDPSIRTTVSGTSLYRVAKIGYFPDSGLTPLRCAAENGHTDCVKLLLDAGADHSPVSKWGWTPLHQAAENGRTDCVKLLLDAGADLSPVSKWGWTPLHWAAKNGHPDCVKLLLDAGADHSPVSNDGKTPLHQAADRGQPNCVKLLLDAGSDHSPVSEWGWTPLYRAAKNGHLDCVKLLLDAGADHSSPKWGWTPLHQAAYNGHTDCVKLLLDAGADLSPVSKWGWTPLYWAAENGHPDCVKLLLDAGADHSLVSKWG